MAQHNARGILSMANKGPNTNGSQFFLTYAKQTHLNNVYPVFGRYVGVDTPRSRHARHGNVYAHTNADCRLIDGMDTLDAIEKVPVKGKKNRPVTDIVIKSITIHANPIADKK